jgi:hypothetical protein
LPAVIKAARPPFDVQYHHDPKNKFKFSGKTTDDEWLAKVAAEGWIVFSHDRKFHTRLAEISAIKQHKAGCFYLPGSQSPTWNKLVYFVRAFEGIEQRIAATARPFIFDLAYTGRFKTILIS